MPVMEGDSAAGKGNSSPLRGSMEMKDDEEDDKIRRQRRISAPSRDDDGFPVWVDDTDAGKKSSSSGSPKRQKRRKKKKQREAQDSEKTRTSEKAGTASARKKPKKKRSRSMSGSAATGLTETATGYTGTTSGSSSTGLSSGVDRTEAPPGQVVDSLPEDINDVDPSPLDSKPAAESTSGPTAARTADASGLVIQREESNGGVVSEMSEWPADAEVRMKPHQLDPWCTSPMTQNTFMTQSLAQGGRSGSGMIRSASGGLVQPNLHNSTDSIETNPEDLHLMHTSTKQQQKARSQRAAAETDTHELLVQYLLAQGIEPDQAQQLATQFNSSPMVTQHNSNGASESAPAGAGAERPAASDDDDDDDDDDDSNDDNEQPKSASSAFYSKAMEAQQGTTPRRPTSSSSSTFPTGNPAATAAAMQHQEQSDQTRVALGLSQRNTSYTTNPDGVVSMNPSSRMYWQRASEPGVQQMEGRAFGAPPRIDPPPRGTDNNSDDNPNNDLEQQLADTTIFATAVTDDSDDFDDDDENNKRIIYAESKPISIMTMLADAPPRRRLLVLFLFVAVCAVIGIAVGFATGGASSKTVKNPGSVPTASPTAMPTLLREDILDAAVKVSGVDALITASDTPQRRAVAWMSTFDEVETVGIPRVFSQRYAMVVFYFATNGKDWIATESDWLDPKTHECDWGDRSVQCTTEPSGLRILTSLDLTRTGLNGFIPPELTLLAPNLVELKVGKNPDLGGPLSSSLIGNLTQLSSLDISSCGLTGALPDTLDKMVDVSSIDLSDNRLNGTLPSSLYKMSVLLTLNLEGNQFEGTLSQALDKLERLVVINVRYNLLSGSLPQLDTAPLLEVVQLDYNMFTGSLPRITGQVAGRKELSFSHNLLKGTLPWTIDLTQPIDISAITIAKIDVSYNDLSGTLPGVLSIVPSLKFLDLSGNNFKGNLTQQWPFMEYLAIKDNQINGTLPFAGMRRLSHLDVSNNDFSGTFADDLYNLTNMEFMILGGNNRLGGTIKDDRLGQLSKLRQIDWNNCDLSGQLPSTSLVKLTDLAAILLQNNRLAGTIPTEIGLLGDTLKQLRLDNNELVGTIPMEITELVILRDLNLANNSFTGTLPLLQLGKLTDLKVVGNPELEGTISTSVCNQANGTLTHADYIGCSVTCDCCSDQEETCGDSDGRKRKR